MLPNSTSFTWWRPEKADSFVWTRIGPALSVRDRKQWFLTRRQGARFVPYQPLKTRFALYRLLADAQPTQEGVLEFANRYGRLGKGVEYTIPKSSLRGVATEEAP